MRLKTSCDPPVPTTVTVPYPRMRAEQILMDTDRLDFLEQSFLRVLV
jgi:hypothetical protein